MMKYYFLFGFFSVIKYVSLVTPETIYNSCRALTMTLNPRRALTMTLNPRVEPNFR